MISKTPILVLSYNICFQAMCNDASGSAYDLGKSCIWLVEDELTICAQNMAEFMDGAPASVGHANFDFVGLQEANNVSFLKKAAKNSLAKLKMIYSKSHATNRGHPMHMASFYDDTKYTLINHVCSQFNSKKTDRPFHILLLSEITTSKKIIFINVHAPHRGSENTKDPGHYYSGFEAVSYDLSQAIKTISAFDPTDTYKIIMTGDFNEVEWDFRSNNIKSKTWKPLSHAGCNEDAKISNIIFSCSKSNGCWTKENGDRGGDYIFASGNPAKISVPSNYKFAPEGACGDIKQMKSIWQSDHLPVMAELS